VLPVGYSRQAHRFDRVELPLLGAKRRFPNGCGRLALCAWEEKSQRAGGHCRCAQGKRNLSGRAGIVAVLKDWQVICLAAGSMIMLGIMLYNDLQ
jgi:hypothetical protein